MFNFGLDGFIGKYFVQFFYSLIKNINVKIDCVDNHISSIKLKKICLNQDQ